ncbi:unnamed protein product [Protopolystoma xenopodis]|uniref:Uncharacterized protein n=1 Tax=Protopolystoma xenopodis TaxID=117903 RepID=A0A448WP38_9PLAT|nr:unnamed protein product [Protopolystoma xenopodis]
MLAGMTAPIGAYMPETVFVPIKVLRQSGLQMAEWHSQAIRERLD